MRASDPNVPVVMIHEEDARDARRLLNVGANAIVLRARLADTLQPTIDAVHAGLVVVPEELRASLDKPLLTAREKQVLAMVVMGGQQRHEALTVDLNRACV